ncbi:hypothetical protein ACX93W_12605 [Paenibacillus sp. CAU 1782]
MNLHNIRTFCHRSIWIILMIVVAAIALAANAKFLQNVYQYVGLPLTIVCALLAAGSIWAIAYCIKHEKLIVPLLKSWGGWLAARPLAVTIAVVSLSVILRGLWLYGFQIDQFESDFEAYFERAASYAGGIYPVDDYSALFPHVFGFSYVLGAVMKVFGSTMLVSQLFNIALYILSIVLLWFLFPAVRYPGRYLFCLFVISLWPSFIYFTTFANTEYMFILCWLLFLLVLKATFTAPFPKMVAFTGLLLLIAALSNFVRPIGSILVIIFVIMVLLSPGPWRLVRRGVLLVVGLVLYFGVSSLLNGFVSDHIQLQAAKMPIGFNVFVGTNPDMQGEDLGLWNANDSQALGLVYNELGDAQAAHDVMLEQGLERLQDWFGSGQGAFFLANKIKTAWGTDGWALQLIDAHMASYAKHEGAHQLYNKLHFKLLGLGDLLYTLLLTAAACVLFVKLRRSSFKPTGLVPLAAALFLIGTFLMLLLVESAPRYHVPGFIALLLAIAGPPADQEGNGQQGA